MNAAEHLLLFGASTRAAAFSALRAGLRPWCADLFADLDLHTCCPVVAIPAGDYPEGFVAVCREAPPGPWMYTGGLENRPELVDKLARLRPLWGNQTQVLRRARSPATIAALLDRSGLACPRVRDHGDEAPREGRWLVKPLAGAGGAGIRVWDGSGGAIRRRQQTYLQEFIEGEPCSAVYLGDGSKARLLGITRQLVGEDWLHAAPFHYCGSIGPLEPGPAERAGFERLGSMLAAGCGLHGLFGVDCVRRDGVPWPVEVNPRYTASVEVLEHALALPILGLHRSIFVPDAPAPASPARAAPAVIGKAILFARAALVFPEAGPWQRSLRQQPDPWELPAFADIPPAGQEIRAHRPILSFFARGPSPADCREALRRTAKALDRKLFNS